MFGSSTRTAPAAALRGLANGASPASSRCSFIATNDFVGISTSPRTSNGAVSPARRIASRPTVSGIERIVRRFAVTSSPTMPSPRVMPRINLAPPWSAAS